MDSTQIIKEQLNEITNSTKITEIIIDIANQIDFNWFEWILKIGIVAVVFLLGKNLVYSFYYYLKLRFDDHVGIGAIIKFNDSEIIGRIKNYTLTYIIIETLDGTVRIPLSVWNTTYWTLLKSNENTYIDSFKSKNKKLELQFEQERTNNKILEDRILVLEKLAEEAKNNNISSNNI